MRLALRTGAIVIAIAALVDPAIARRVAAPISMAFELPRASDPGHRQAMEMRARIEAGLDDDVIVDGPLDPSAIVAIGNAELTRTVDAPVFVLASAVTPSVRIEGITTPRGLVSGQAAPVRVALLASKLSGRTSSIALELGGTRLESVDHEWTSDDERFEGTFTLVLPAPGLHRVRAIVTTDGVDGAVADAAVVVRDRPLRVLAYEPRPSWPVTFVRRSLESDPMFSLASTTRSSRPAATRSSDAPASLSGLDPDAFDALILGGLDEVSGADWGAVERFVSDRGGTLVLLPDRQVPESLRRRFDLPQAEEVLLENPVGVEDAGLKGAEFLLLPPATEGVRTLATIRHGRLSRPAIVAVPVGAGTLILSGALDSWRYRAEGDGQFDRFWQGLVADAALSAAAKIDVTLTPAIARPGDPIVVRTTVRETEFISNGGSRSAGPVEGSLIRENGTREPIRLWPGSRLGSFEATIPAPPTGRHVVEVAATQARTDVPLLVADDVVLPVRDTGAAWRHAAAASGGGLVQTSDELIAALSKLNAVTVEQVIRPMRSPWWIVPFALLLSAEWALRRRSGLK
jgi:hypothetical protein